MMNNEYCVSQSLRNRYFSDDTASVVETINGAHQKGRIKAVGGVYWSAVNCQDERILKGERVRLLQRQGNTWIVEMIAIPGMAPRYMTERPETAERIEVQNHNGAAGNHADRTADDYVLVNHYQ